MSNAGWTFHKAVRYWASSLDPTWQKVLRQIIQESTCRLLCCWATTFHTWRPLCSLQAGESGRWEGLSPNWTRMRAAKEWNDWKLEQERSLKILCWERGALSGTLKWVETWTRGELVERGGACRMDESREKVIEAFEVQSRGGAELFISKS